MRNNISVECVIQKIDGTPAALGCEPLIVKSRGDGLVTLQFPDETRYELDIEDLTDALERCR